MTETLFLPPRYREMVDDLLREHVPGVEVWAYGSRVIGDAHDASDLDLVLRSPTLERLGPELEDLRDAFQESNLPILVQAHDWAELPESFHHEIARLYVVLSSPEACSD